MSIIIKGGSNSQLANVDSLGNLQVLQSPAAISSVAAPWTSATVDNTTQILLSTGGFAAMIVQLNQTSTITGGAVTFEGTYDGINWFQLPALFVVDPQSYVPVSIPYTFQPNTNKAFLIIVGGSQQVRARLDPVIIGTGQVQIYWTLLATSPIRNTSVVNVGNLPMQPDTFNTGQVTSTGNTAIWTPATGMKFRLLKYMIEGTLNMAQQSQGVLTVSFQDGTSQMPFAHDVMVGSTAIKYNVAYTTGWIDLGGTGFLSSAANNVLNVNLTSALTAGNFRVTVAGTEE